MSVTPELLDTLCKALADGNAARAGIDRELRAAFPELTFAVCSDDDIPSRVKPVAEGDGFRLYGINISDHCAGLTGDLDAASGLTIALTDDEE